MQIIWGFYLVWVFFFFYSFFLSRILQLVGKLLVFSYGKLPLINNFQFLNKKSYFPWKVSAKDLMNLFVHTGWDNSSDRCYRLDSNLLRFLKHC